MLQTVITYSFYLLFALTPLLWAPWNFELFEYNKMMFVYLLTIIIAFSWILQMLGAKKLILKTTPLDLPLVFFLLANIASTIFSVDRHVSLWGYYSRSNGGLLSLIAYLLLYYALVSHFDKDQILKFLKTAIFGGVVVALYAIPEHFGVSPSCVFLTGNFSASCWVQDVQARVFATLGQPNWLAAYLGMLIFPTIYFALTSASRSSKILYTLYSILFYLAFTFTYSRGATLGFISGILVFAFFISHPHLSVIPLKRGIQNFSQLSGPLVPFDKLRAGKPGMTIILSFILINLIFGSALTDFKLLSKFAPPPRPSLTTARIVGTQLESGGTESGAIRLIVWKGALDIFKHYPLFGSGVETFAYSYYQFRPESHNLVSEWDFLYNKAHNEFLNYLATTGIFGFASYMAVIVTFITWCIKYNVLSIKGRKDSSIIHTTYPVILITSLLASYVSYLVQNFFGFSVVIIALFFYLFSALAFVLTDSTKPLQLPKTLNRSPLYTTLGIIVASVIFGLLLFTLVRYYVADTFFAQGSRLSDSHPTQAFNELLTASALNPGEPYYQSELGYAAAASSVTLALEEATESARLKHYAVTETERALRESPGNVSFYRTAVRTYYLLATEDKIYNQKTLEALDQAIKLAPTDAKLIYNKALILDQMGKIGEAATTLEKAIQLKPNYKEALEKLNSWKK